jgi:hypothetical protein
MNKRYRYNTRDLVYFKLKGAIFLPVHRRCRVSDAPCENITNFELKKNKSSEMPERFLDIKNSSGYGLIRSGSEYEIPLPELSRSGRRVMVNPSGYFAGLTGKKPTSRIRAHILQH